MLDEEGELSTHPSIDQKCDRISRDGAADRDRVVLERWNVSEQGASNDLDEIEERIEIDERALGACNKLMIPKYRGDEECELQQIADDLLDVPESRAQEGERDDDPIAVHKQQSEAWD